MNQASHDELAKALEEWREQERVHADPLTRDGMPPQQPNTND
jgi:hypothetical protein